MDPITALGVGAASLQFIDFATKVVAKGYKLHKSVDGQLVESGDLAATAKNLILLNERVQESLPEGPQYFIPSESEDVVRECCKNCQRTATELVEALEDLRIQGRHTKWNSLRKALKTVRSKEKIDNMRFKLETSRQELNTSLLFFVM